MTQWTVDIQNNHNKTAVLEESVASFIQELLAHLQEEVLPESVSNVSILFVDDEEIRNLNRDYRMKDKATDVLSFSLLEGDDAGPAFSLGDIVISIDTCMKQADSYTVTHDQECARLLIHGLLHLFGYDHEDVAEEEVIKMQEKEDLLMTVFENNPYIFFS